MDILESVSHRADDDAPAREHVTVSLDCEVTDPEALFSAAVAHAMREDGLTKQEAHELLRPDDEIDCAACLQMILDTGSRLDAGFTIEQSRTE